MNVGPQGGGDVAAQVRCVVTNVGPTQESDLHVSVVEEEVGLT
jgi:hypothetical protein